MCIRDSLYREDVESFTDLAEEVIREYGYDHIVPTFLNPASVTKGNIDYSYIEGIVE